MTAFLRTKERHCYLVAFVIIVMAGLIEYAMGRTPMCKCGYVKLWVSAVNSSENSQQIADWYSFSHIIHGFIGYGVFHLIGRGKWSFGQCLVMAVFVEASWEVIENTPLIINRYRAITMSLDYYGDSVLNSMCDILFCILGFVLAARLRTWIIVTLAILMELGVGYAIHDNLTLNVIMLLHPFEAIKHWQMGV